MPFYDVNYVREKLCEKEMPRASCGTSHKGEPLLCVEVQTCIYHATPCMKCLDGAVPLLSDAGATNSDLSLRAVSSVAHRPETSDQQIARLTSEQRVRDATRILGGLLTLTIVSAIVVIFRRARKQPVARMVYALLSLSIIITGASAWRYQSTKTNHQRLLSEIADQNNLGPVLRPIQAGPVPAPLTNRVIDPDTKPRNQHLEHLLDAKLPGWQSQAIDAGAYSEYEE